jgi:hypothetical protein
MTTVAIALHVLRSLYGKQLAGGVAVVIGVGMWVAGNFLRKNGLAGFDHVHDFTQNLGILEIMYVFFLGYGWMYMTEVIMNVVKYIVNHRYLDKLPRINLAWALLTIYPFPWYTITVCMLLKLRDLNIN